MGVKYDRKLAVFSITFRRKPREKKHKKERLHRFKLFKVSCIILDVDIII